MVKTSFTRPFSMIGKQADPAQSLASQAGCNAVALVAREPYRIAQRETL